MASKLVKASLLTAVFAGAALTGCDRPPPPPHNEYNITMHCIGRPAEKFEGVDLTEGISLYHVRKYDVVNGNQLQLSFEKNFRKFGCTKERERVAAPPAPVAPAAPAPK